MFLLATPNAKVAIFWEKNTLSLEKNVVDQT